MPRTTPQEYHYRVTQMTPEEANAHSRRCYNVAADVGLGWTPYNYYVTHGAISHWACHTEAQFINWISLRQFAQPNWSEWNNGMRHALLTKKEN